MRLYKMDQSTSIGSFLDSWNFGRRIEDLQIERNKLPSQVFRTIWTASSVVVGDNKDPKKQYRNAELNSMTGMP